MERDQVFAQIGREVDYAIDKWEHLPRDVRSQRDAGKQVEFWIMHVHRYVHEAMTAAYDTDKTKALDALRKAAGLMVRCFTYHGCPWRAEWLEQEEKGDMGAQNEIDRLAAFILAHCPDEVGRGNPREGESAVDVAIRLLGERPKQVNIYGKTG